MVGQLGVVFEIVLGMHRENVQVMSHISLTHDVHVADLFIHSYTSSTHN